MPIRKHFTAKELRARRKAIARALRMRTKDWGVVGWAFVGPADKLALHVRISPLRPAPRRPQRRLSLQPGFGRVLVHFAHLAAWKAPDIASFGGEPMTSPLAPGAPILVGAGAVQRSGGIAAVLVIDGDLHLLTCGHIFRGPTEVFTPGEQDEPIARLTRNYLRDDAPLDVAVCKLSARGLRLLDASASAATWFSGLHALTSGAVDAASDVTFWPTNRIDRTPLDVTISSFDASTAVLFDGDPEDGFIEAAFAAIPGDSGSLLSIDDAYLGICSGQVDEAQSYFTPIAAAIERLRGDFGNVDLWKPGDGADAQAPSSSL